MFRLSIFRLSKIDSAISSLNKLYFRPKNSHEMLFCSSKMEDLNVIVFPITYYSSETVNYIKQLPEDVIYYEMSDEYTPDILTAILGRIISIEYDAYYRIRTFPDLLKEVNNNWILKQVADICPQALSSTNLVKSPVLYDIYQRDLSLFGYLNLFFAVNIVDLPYVFVLTKDGRYIAHIYAWLVGDDFVNVVNIIGIRSSILELMSAACGNKVQGIGGTLINSIYNWAKDQNLNNCYLRVIHPIGPMPAILERYNFNKVSSLNNVVDISWIDNYLGNTLLLEKGKGLRQSDYIISVK